MALQRHGIAHTTYVGKKFELGEDGKLKKTLAPFGRGAKVLRKEFETFRDYADWRQGLDCTTMLLSGQWKAHIAEGAAVTTSTSGGRTAGGSMASGPGLPTSRP